jgi:hypothetical protein
MCRALVIFSRGFAVVGIHVVWALSFSIDPAGFMLRLAVTIIFMLLRVCAGTQKTAQRDSHCESNKLSKNAVHFYFSFLLVQHHTPHLFTLPIS